jgi:hypothetical protein
MKEIEFNKELSTNVKVTLDDKKVLMTTKNARFESVEQAVEYGYNALKYFPEVNTGVVSVALEQEPHYKKRFRKSVQTLRELEQSL